MRITARDPWLTDRLRADLVLVTAEKKVEAAALAAINDWLHAVHALLLGGRPIDSRPDNIGASANPPRSKTGNNISSLVADGEFTLDFDAVQASFGTWAGALENRVEPAISEAFGDGFGGSLRSATVSPLPYQEAHIRDVHSRLKLWPQEAWEDMRPELQQIVSRSGTIEEAAKAVAGILDIDAPTRKLRAQITEVDVKIDGAESPGEVRTLRAQRRQLWKEHDASLGQWQHLARRIARTEVQGAIEGGTLAGAQATAQATGQKMFKRWLATSDSRTRRSHTVADGQIVALEDRFRVGRAHLKHPAEPGGPGNEVIHCRCTMQILTQDEVDQALAGHWGRRGVQPMSLRMGPDDPSAVDMADGLLQREQSGENVQWPDKEPPPPAPEPVPEPPPAPVKRRRPPKKTPPPPPEQPVAPQQPAPEPAPEPEPEPVAPETPAPPPKRAPRPPSEFKGMSLDHLETEMTRAGDDQDWDYLDRVIGEHERRTAANAAAQAKRAARREAKQAEQMSRYEELVAGGTEDEEAVAEAFGISVDKQRSMNAIAYLRGLGYQGDSLGDLVKAWQRDEAYNAWLAAESATNGQMLAPLYRDKLQIDPRNLWQMSDTQATKYASDELKQWWDIHGRVTVAELRAQLLDPAELARIQSARRDYLQ